MFIISTSQVLKESHHILTTALLKIKNHLYYFKGLRSSYVLASSKKLAFTGGGRCGGRGAFVLMLEKSLV